MTSLLPRLILLGLCSAALGLATAAPLAKPGLAGDTPTPILRHSTVIGGLNNLDAVPPEYDLDLVINLMDMTDESEIPRWKAVVDRFHAQGKLFFAGLLPATPAGRTMERFLEDPGLREAACLDLNLQPIVPEWQIGRQHKGHPIHLYCSNHPRYRAYIRHLVFMYFEAGPDGVFVDDAGGTPSSYASGGCFCPWCMARFRDYLGARLTPAQWQALNLGDLAAFDYRLEVRKHARDLPTLKAARQRGEIPLAAEFADFLRATDAELFQSLHSMADRLSGRHVALTWDNYNFSPSRMAYYPTIDALAPELVFRAFAPDGRGDDGRYPPAIVLLQRVSDALGKWYTPIPAPPTWAAVKAGNLTGLLRLWIASTYATGGLPRYPRRGWCTVGKGGVVEWYDAPKAEFEPLYAFVRTHRPLLDSYENIPQVGVVFSEQSATLHGPPDTALKHVAGGLVDLNVPFGIVVAGSRHLSQRLGPDDARHFELLLVPDGTKLDEAQQRVVDVWKTDGTAVTVSRTDDLAARLAGRVEPLAALEGKSDVRLFPRRHATNPDAPVVCHLVNWAYDPATNATPPQRQVTVRLRSALTGGAKVTQITYHTPGRPAQSLPFTVRDDAVRVTIPEVALWGILELQHH